MDLKGQILDEETKEVVNLIDELVATQKTTNAFGEEDILTRALGGKDRPGILRGVGKYVTKKKYFHNATQQKTNEKEDEKATSKEHDQMAKRIKELEDELLKMKEKDDCLGNLKEEPYMDSKEKSSIEGAENVNDLEDLSNDLESQKDVEDVIELNEEIKVGTPCKLAFEKKDHVVAWGTMIVSDVEGDNVKVTVDVVVDGDCAIPIPSEQWMYKMSQEVGSHILWPRDLVITDNIKMDYGEFTKDMTTFALTPIQNAPVALRFLLRMVEHMGLAIQITTPYDVFGVRRKCCIMIESLKDFTSMRPIATACLDVYIILRSTLTDSLHFRMKDSPRAYTHDDIDCIRSEWAEFVGKHVSLWAEFGVWAYVLLKCCVFDHEVLLKCVVDKKVLLKCVVDHEVLLKCVLYVVDHEVLLKFRNELN
ncbi:hypothetical protein IC582_005292 [Cucumis melo]